MDMVIQTWRFPLLQHSGAVAKRIVVLHHLQICIQPHPIGIGTIVNRPVLYYATCLEHPGERFLGDAYHRIALAVLEQDVVMGVVLLYEVILKDQGLILIAGYDVINRVDLLNKGRCLGIAVGKEIRSDAAAQVLGLADIDNGTFPVLHQIAARILRHLARHLPCACRHNQRIATTKRFGNAILQYMPALQELISSFSQEEREALDALFSRYHFTESQKLEIAKDESDLRQWKEPSFIPAAPYSRIDSRKDGRKGDAFMKALREHMDHLRSSETDYSTFFPEVKPREKCTSRFVDKRIVLGRCPCPVDGEKTRCCRLRTLDAIEQCAFSCSYCSVQAFYNENEIHAVSGIKEKLLSCTPDPDVWHIGTGQASDSLLFGDDFGTLSALSAFAEKHPEIIIELKSKSARNVFDRKYPRNMVFTWSLNAPTIIEKEEHLTASLEGRLENAERARDNGNLVGFHIHPMVYFKGWDEEYPRLAKMIESRFRPEDVCMVGIGTLTFTKAVIRHLRERGDESRVLEMDLVPASGKFSYPLETKERMFSTVFHSFSEAFRNNVFFYLCMEDPSLWMPALGREYSSDREFEEDMKRHYREAVARL